ncbi:MAG: hypothetical protein NC127_05285 [Muribaculum sp.]|nr:hypothetical protein [Muribaculum sp.]
MSRKYFMIIVVLISGLTIFAQNPTPNSYQTALSDNDISMEIPVNFRDINIAENNVAKLSINQDYVPKYGYPDKKIGWPYKFGIVSDKNDCAILYSSITPEFVSLSNAVEDEIQAYRSDSDIDVTEYLTMITDEDMSKYANADTVLVYDLELDVPYLDKYGHCVTIYLRKYAHPAMFIKVLMDDNGLRKKEEYVRTAMNSIKYGDTPTKPGLEGEEKFAIPTKFPLSKKVWVKPKDGYIN